MIMRYRSHTHYVKVNSNCVTQADLTKNNWKLKAINHSPPEYSPSLECLLKLNCLDWHRIIIVEWGKTRQGMKMVKDSANDDGRYVAVLGTWWFFWIYINNEVGNLVEIWLLVTRHHTVMHHKLIYKSWELFTLLLLSLRLEPCSVNIFAPFSFFANVCPVENKNNDFIAIFLKIVKSLATYGDEIVR